MPRNKLSQSEELQCIYVTLRRLRFIKNPDLQRDDPENEMVRLNPLSPVRIFPRKFLYKLLEERLVSLNKKSISISNDLFKIIGTKIKRVDEQLLKQVVEEDREVKRRVDDMGPYVPEIQKSIKYPELDVYFHHCLYHLHDYIIELDWHETNLYNVGQSDLEYVSEKLPFMKDFMKFQRELDTRTLQQPNRVNLNKGLLKNVVRQSPRSPIEEPAKSEGRTSILSPSRRLSSPGGHKKRVRFSNLPPSNISLPLGQTIDERLVAGRYAAEFGEADAEDRLHEVILRDIRETQSVYALDLLIYSLDLFAQRLRDKLLDWTAQYQTNVDSSLDILLKSNQKIRTSLLRSIVKKLKIYNDVYLTILDHLGELRETYIKKHIATVLMSCDSPQIQTEFKRPRLNVYLTLVAEIESKLLTELSRQCLKILMDLIVAELNLDPFEPNSRSEENLLNFVGTWLNIDHVIFGITGEPKVPNEKADEKKQPLKTPRSNLSLEDNFKSSSRIMNQVENLQELMRVLTKSIVARLRNPQQIKYFFDLLLCGLDQAFDRLAVKMPPGDDLLIAARIRCLKFIYIMGSLVGLLNEEASRNKIELDDQKLESKMARYSDLCMQVPWSEITAKV